MLHKFNVRSRYASASAFLHKIHFYGKQLVAWISAIGSANVKVV